MMATVAAGILLQLFSLMWSSPDVIGQFSPNVVSFSPNVVLRDPLFSLNVVSKPRMLSVRGNYVLSSLHLGRPSSQFRSPIQLHSRIPANEGLPKLVIEHLRPHLEQIVRTGLTLSHLLLLDHALAHHLIHRRLRECR